MFLIVIQYSITTITVHHTVAISVSLSIVFYEINNKHSELFPEYITSLFLINHQSNSCAVWQGLSAKYNDSLRVFKIFCREKMQIEHNRKEMWLRPPASKSSLLTLTAHFFLSLLIGILQYYHCVLGESRAAVDGAEGILAAGRFSRFNWWNSPCERFTVTLLKLLPQSQALHCRQCHG